MPILLYVFRQTPSALRREFTTRWSS